MTQDQIDTINIIQEALRGILIAMTAQPNVDMEKLALALQAAASNPAISPMSQKMLSNLAELPDMLAKTKKPTH